MRFVVVTGRSLLALAIAVLTLGIPDARAAVFTYTYTGNDYTIINNGGSIPQSYTTSKMGLTPLDRTRGGLRLSSDVFSG